jgi:hypothetical protein
MFYLVDKPLMSIEGAHKAHHKIHGLEESEDQELDGTSK